jgi:hypothetical protein
MARHNFDVLYVSCWLCMSFVRRETICHIHWEDSRVAQARARLHIFVSEYPLRSCSGLFGVLLQVSVF